MSDNVVVVGGDYGDCLGSNSSITFVDMSKFRSDDTNARVADEVLDSQKVTQ